VVALYIILVYDVGVERINQVRAYLKQYLNWIQNSAFEGELTEGELAKIKVGLHGLIVESKDSLIIFKISNKRWIDKEIIGIEKSEVSTLI
jgi:CRISPR-associated protein Cas2